MAPNTNTTADLPASRTERGAPTVHVAAGKTLQEWLRYLAVDARNILEQPDGFDPPVVGWALDMLDADLRVGCGAQR